MPCDKCGRRQRQLHKIPGQGLRGGGQCPCYREGVKEGQGKAVAETRAALDKQAYWLSQDVD